MIGTGMSSHHGCTFARNAALRVPGLPDLRIGAGLSGCLSGVRRRAPGRDPRPAVTPWWARPSRDVSPSGPVPRSVPSVERHSRTAVRPSSSTSTRTRHAGRRSADGAIASPRTSAAVGSVDRRRRPLSRCSRQAVIEEPTAAVGMWFSVERAFGPRRSRARWSMGSAGGQAGRSAASASRATMNGHEIDHPASLEG